MKILKRYEKIKTYAKKNKKQKRYRVEADHIKPDAALASSHDHIKRDAALAHLIAERQRPLPLPTLFARAASPPAVGRETVVRFSYQDSIHGHRPLVYTSIIRQYRQVVAVRELSLGKKIVPLFLVRPLGAKPALQRGPTASSKQGRVGGDKRLQRP